MFVRRSLVVAALVISVARCGEQPTAVHPAVPQLLSWADTTSLFSASLSQPNAPSHSTLSRAGITGSGVYAGPPAPLVLEQKRVSFWAVRGEARTVQINYKGSHDVEAHPFLLLTITDPQFVPGIGELAVGDSVLITVKVDTRKLMVSLEPTGLLFGAPAQLTLWYGGSKDQDVTNQRDLGLFYREDHKHPWVRLNATQSITQESFTYDIPHFSQYAVASLMDWSTSW